VVIKISLSVSSQYEFPPLKYLLFANFSYKDLQASGFGGANASWKCAAGILYGASISLGGISESLEGAISILEDLAAVKKEWQLRGAGSSVDGASDSSKGAIICL